MWLICNATLGKGRNKLLVRGVAGVEYVFCPSVKGIKRDKVGIDRCQRCRHFVCLQQLDVTTTPRARGRAYFGREEMMGIRVERRPTQRIRDLVTGASLPRMTDATEPLIDIFEDEDSVMMIANLSGVEEEDVKLEVENNMLTISTNEIHEKVVLPTTVKKDAVESAYRNGVLEVRLKKAT